MIKCANCGGDITDELRYSNYNPLDTKEYCSQCSHLAGPHVKIVYKDTFRGLDREFKETPQPFLEPVELHEQITELAEENVKLDDVNIELRNEISRLEANNNNLDNEIDDKNDDIGELADHNEMLLEEILEFRESERDNQREIHALRYTVEILKEILRR